MCDFGNRNEREGGQLLVWSKRHTHTIEMEGEEDNKRARPAELCERQQLVIDHVRRGGNVFMTGPAGTGKSHLLKYILDILTNEEGKKVYVTSSTGVSALSIGGTTIHRFAGIGLGDGTVAESIRSASTYAKAKWLKCDTLIIDEISMINAELFTKLDLVARAVRANDTPFGGIQLVICGDFFQLPPVTGKYAFQCPAWRASLDSVILLNEIHRQSELTLVEGLNEMRHGRVSDAFIELLTKDEEEFYRQGNGVLPSRLLSKNRDVDEINQRELAALQTPKVTFTSKDWSLSSSTKMDDYFPVGSELTLAEGAQVILLKNVDGYVNGTRGVVKEMVGDTVQVTDKNGQTYTVVPQVFEAREQGRVIATRTALPIKLAWSISIHRSQGLSIDYLDINLRGVFSPAQAYVAISRATNLAGLRVSGLSSTVVYCNDDVVAYYDALENAPNGLTELHNKL